MDMALLPLAPLLARSLGESGVRLALAFSGMSRLSATSQWSFATDETRYLLRTSLDLNNSVVEIWYPLDGVVEIICPLGLCCTL